MGVNPKIGVSPKWMVKIVENPIDCICDPTKLVGSQAFSKRPSTTSGSSSVETCRKKKKNNPSKTGRFPAFRKNGGAAKIRFRNFTFYLENIGTWNPKQPFINRCLVKQPFPM